MKKQKSTVKVSPKNTIADAQQAKAIAKAIATGADGNASALKCMELETEAGWQITTCRVNPVTRECESIKRECNIKRITPLTVTVEIRYGKVNIEANYLAEGWIDGIYPTVTFTMDYRVEVGKRAQRPFFTAECREDMTDASGIFAQVLKECKIDTFNTAIKWEENAGYQVWFSLHLSYSHFDGGSNGMGIADFFFDGKEWSKYRFKGEEEK